MNYDAHQERYKHRRDHAAVQDDDELVASTYDKHYRVSHCIFLSFCNRQTTDTKQPRTATDLRFCTTFWCDNRQYVDFCFLLYKGPDLPLLLPLLLVRVWLCNFWQSFFKSLSLNLNNFIRTWLLPVEFICFNAISSTSTTIQLAVHFSSWNDFFWKLSFETI